MTMVLVKGRFENPDNSYPAKGEIVWQLAPSDIPDLAEPVVVLGGPVRVPLNSDGSFQVELRATDDPELIPNVIGPLTYKVSRNINGHKVNFTVTLPAPGPWDWTELSPVPESDAIVVPVQGPPGPAGATGPAGPEGPPGPPLTITGSVPSAPNLPTGAEPGDAYITDDTGHVWVWDGTQWTDVGAFQGPPGPQGSQGIPGPQGIPGVKGDTGSQGIQGIPGTPGATGSQGPKGDTGDTGSQGIQGIPGPTGSQGPAGGFAARNVVAYSATAITASLPDAGAYVRFTGANPTYTVPPNATVAFPNGTQIDGVGTASAMTLVQGAGVVLNKPRTLVTVAADSGWSIIKVGTDEWDAHGDFV